MREAHPRPFALGEAELPAVGAGLEQHPPSLEENRAELLRSGALDDGIGELGRVRTRPRSASPTAAITSSICSCVMPKYLTQPCVR
jgi:hypothetical protein